MANGLDLCRCSTTTKYDNKTGALILLIFLFQFLDRKKQRFKYLIEHMRTDSVDYDRLNT